MNLLGARVTDACELACESCESNLGLLHHCAISTAHGFQFLFCIYVKSPFVKCGASNISLMWEPQHSSLRTNAH